MMYSVDFWLWVSLKVKHYQCRRTVDFLSTPVIHQQQKNTVLYVGQFVTFIHQIKSCPSKICFKSALTAKLNYLYIYMGKKSF